jgi:hypothetical protein
MGGSALSPRLTCWERSSARTSLAPASSASKALLATLCGGDL